jgi:hypothetical protein
MSNMSYCRFENTKKDLDDCQDAIDNLVAAPLCQDGEEAEPLSDREEFSAKYLLKTCLALVEQVAEAQGRDLGDLDDTDIDAFINEIQAEAKKAAAARTDQTDN